jgi:hypothetical protein
MQILYLALFIACFLYNQPQQPANAAYVTSITAENTNGNPYPTIGSIPVPQGYNRLPAANGTYAAWLRSLPLKKNKTVFLYNGMPKTNQAAQFAVIDMPVGNKDLQQCADAVMRLRAEYLYGQHRCNAIDFTDNAHTHYRLPNGASRAAFDQYLEKVFSYCGTASLEKQLVAVNDLSGVQAGDVLIKGGAPGHAMQVVDAAINAQGKKIYLLAQSYMPAQDIHVVVNPGGGQLTPWYSATGKAFIETPEWVFAPSNLRKWPQN